MSRVVGDTYPPIQGTCFGQRPADILPTPADLTGTTLDIHVKRPDGTTFTRPGVIDTPSTSGNWTLTLLSTDLTVHGTYTVNAVVTFAGGSKETFGPSFFSVTQAVA